MLVRCNFREKECFLNLISKRQTLMKFIKVSIKNTNQQRKREDKSDFVCHFQRYSGYSQVNDNFNMQTCTLREQFPQNSFNNFSISKFT